MPSIAGPYNLPLCSQASSGLAHLENMALGTSQDRAFRFHVEFSKQFSERPLQRELQHTRSVQRVDDLKFAEAWVRHEKASLIESCAIATGGGTIWVVTKRRGRVLYGIHSCPVLDVIVDMIHRVEDLRLQGDCVSIVEVKAAGQSNVDLLCPRPIERIQSGKRTRAAGINTESRVWRTLQRGGIVDGIRQCADVEQRRVGPSRGELHGSADGPM